MAARSQRQFPLIALCHDRHPRLQDRAGKLDAHFRQAREDLAALNVVRNTSAVEDADIGRMIDNLREQRRSWSPVERGAAKDHVVAQGPGIGRNLRQGAGPGIVPRRVEQPDIRQQPRDAKGLIAADAQLRGRLKNLGHSSPRETCNLGLNSHQQPIGESSTPR